MHKALVGNLWASVLDGLPLLPNRGWWERSGPLTALPRSAGRIGSPFRLELEKANTDEFTDIRSGHARKVRFA